MCAFVRPFLNVFYKKNSHVVYRNIQINVSIRDTICESLIKTWMVEIYVWEKMQQNQGAFHRLQPLLTKIVYWLETKFVTHFCSNFFRHRTVFPATKKQQDLQLQQQYARWVLMNLCLCVCASTHTHTHTQRDVAIFIKFLFYIYTS